MKRLRAFFDERGFVELETPLLAPEVIPELHIEPVAVPFDDKSAERSATQWLQASPELSMKRLLAEEDFAAIYQVTKSFRRGERGRIHHPEFTIVEWYRVGDDMAGGMALLDELMHALCNTPATKKTSYAHAFALNVGVDAHTATAELLRARATDLEIPEPEGMRADDRDEWLNLLLAAKVEPALGQPAPEILYHYPASQSALATTTEVAAGIEAAERFELYWRGVELANGYNELTDAAVLRARFEEVNRRRQADNRPALPLPESLLTAMENGLPPCAGCALGFDRLAMLACGAEAIDEVM